MKWTLEHTEIGHLSIMGSLFERLEWTWSAVGSEVVNGKQMPVNELFDTVPGK